MIRVTATDAETGETSSAEVMDDYVLITTGSCHVSDCQDYPTKGTRVITIKGRRAAPKGPS